MTTTAFQIPISSSSWLNGAISNWTRRNRNIEDSTIEAAEKRPLSYQTPQSVHGCYCGVPTLPLKMHYQDENWEGNRENGVVRF